VIGDVQQMAHVFQNLLSNSLKYSRAGVPPEIQVSARTDGDVCTVSIRDNGIGFDQGYAERIFGLFKRLHKEEYPGTGLGLAICKRIVERYRGSIWAEGRPGEGATFYFALPLAEASVRSALSQTATS
jgi:signal transduction histidine kinase